MHEITMARKTAAYKVHMDIMAAGEVAAEAFSTFCRLLKTMRDDKLYQELEYSSFEAYCENAVGMKYRQAFNYIKVLENFGESNLQSNAGLGIRKLELLGTVPEESRDTFIDENKLQEMTTREVEAAVKEYKEKLAEKEKELKQKAEYAEKQAGYAEESNKRARDAEWDLGKKQTAMSKLQTDLEYIKKQLEEAKKADNSSKSQEEIKRLQAGVIEQADMLDKLQEENERLQKELKSQPIEASVTKVVEVVPVKDLAKILNSSFGALLASNNITRQDIEIIANQAEFHRKEEIIEMLEGLEKIVPEYIKILKSEPVKAASTKNKTCEDCQHCEWEGLQEEDELRGMILCTRSGVPQLWDKHKPCHLFKEL